VSSVDFRHQITGPLRERERVRAREKERDEERKWARESERERERLGYRGEGRSNHCTYRSIADKDVHRP
jgi:hypothetical protein